MRHLHLQFLFIFRCFLLLFCWFLSVLHILSVILTLNGYLCVHWLINISFASIKQLGLQLFYLFLQFSYPLSLATILLTMASFLGFSKVSDHIAHLSHLSLHALLLLLISALLPFLFTLQLIHFMCQHLLCPTH